MDNIYTSISLALLANRNFAINCENSTGTVDSIIQYILEPLSLIHDEVDVGNIPETNSSLISLDSAITIWKGVDKLSETKQRDLIRVLNELENYDTNKERFTSAIAPRPQKVVIVIVQDNSKIIQQLKLKFWFCQYFSGHLLRKGPSGILAALEYVQQIQKYRDQDVYMAPDIQKYIYSLIVHTRNHRLCMVSPMKTRLPSSTIQFVELLAKTYVKWSHIQKEHCQNTANENRNAGPRLFVTPDDCKIAMRKVAYWLISWYDDRLKEGGDEYLKVLRYTLMAGDWYGSDWKYINMYIEMAQEKGKNNYNVIVEDALQKVQPPI